MGLIQSADTVYAIAYLTELGRQYLFDSPKKPRYLTDANGKTIDRLRIERFSLGDPDVNYDLPLLLESGDVPDLSGENENAITGAKGRTLTNLICPNEASFLDTDDLSYSTTNDVIAFDLSKALSSIPTVVTQQLMTFINGEFTTDGSYTVTPTNYGPNYVDANNILTLTLKTPTTTEAGYRLRIFFPTIGSSYNTVKFQFEKGTLNTGTVVTTVSSTVVSTTGAVLSTSAPAASSTTIAAANTTATAASTSPTAFSGGI